MICHLSSSSTSSSPSSVEVLTTIQMKLFNFQWFSVFFKNMTVNDFLRLLLKIVVKNSLSREREWEWESEEWGKIIYLWNNQHTIIAPCGQVKFVFWWKSFKWKILQRLNLSWLFIHSSLIDFYGKFFFYIFDKWPRERAEQRER